MNTVNRYFKQIKNKLFTIQMAKAITNLLFISLNIPLFFVNIYVWIKIVIFGFLYFTYFFVTNIIAEIEKEKLELPKMAKRFTKKEPNGAVTIDEDRFRQAILYLYEIEDRLYK